MVEKRLIRTVAVTAACILGIGFYMQSTSPKMTGAGEGATLASAEVPLPKEPDSATLAIQGITLTSTRAQPVSMDDAPGAERSSPTPACEMVATATPNPDAMVQLSVSAPCRGGERVTVHHSGMMFTDRLDGDGYLNVVIPALAKVATFIVEAKGSDPSVAGAAVATTQVPALDEFERVVLQWDGNSGFEIHALEFGAQYGEEGHVWRGAETETGLGRVIQLGDATQLAPQLAEIYSLPTASVGRSGPVEISIETEITEINCGRDIAAQTLRFGPGGVQTRDLVLSMPACDAIGDFLVLNNLVENLKIAAN